MADKTTEVVVQDERPSYFLYDPSDTFTEVRSMMAKYGYRREKKQCDADFVLFVGGPDLHPIFYGETKLKSTVVSLDRDRHDVRILRNCVDTRHQAKIGICRGAQFLNVMVGNGTLVQHVDGHANGYHDAFDGAGNILRVSSTHHQQMVPGPNAKVILKASETTHWKYDCWEWELGKNDKNEGDDPEVIYYPEENALCFQPHPEFTGAENLACQKLFFEMLEEYFLTTSQQKALKEHLIERKKKVA
jgi:hypothetical protein